MACDNDGCTSLDVARCLPRLAPNLAPRDLVSSSNVQSLISLHEAEEVGASRAWAAARDRTKSELIRLGLEGCEMSASTTTAAGSTSWPSSTAPTFTGHGNPEHYCPAGTYCSVASAEVGRKAWGAGVERAVRTADGRGLAVADYGEPGGIPVLVHMGTIHSRHLYGPNVADAAARGLRLISYDRPGYGGSAPHPGPRTARAMSGRSARRWVSTGW